MDQLPVRPTEFPAGDFSMTLRVVIADDEPLSRERLKRFLNSEPNTDIVAECASGSEALNAIRQHSPDVAFLDVRMPELDAFAILEALQGEPSPAVILVTAFDHFALRAFEIEAVDYLLKPFDRRRFQAALRRVRRRLQLERAQGESREETLTPAQASGPKPLERITVRSAGRILLIKTSEIEWVSAADNYVELHVGSKIHLLRMTISAMADRLTHNRFARISRSVLVNQDQILEIRSKSHGDFFVVLNNGVSLPGSRNYRRGLDGLLRS